MSLETVQVLVVDDQVVPQPLDGVVVRVFDSAGAVFITSGTTGDVIPGAVEFTLDGGDPPTRYQLRFYRIGTSIASPQYIDVYSPASNSPTGTNNFRVSATVRTLPAAVDPRLCRASGYVRNGAGQPLKNLELHFISTFSPLIVDGIGIYGERVIVTTDADGYVSIDLYRCGSYQVTLESHDNVQRLIAVPDRSSVNINNLLFPILVGVQWDPPPPWTVPVGDELEVVPTLTASDYRELSGTASEDAAYTSADTAVASVTTREDKIIIRGEAAGTTTLTVTRRDTSVVYVPDPGIDGSPATIIVT